MRTPFYAAIRCLSPPILDAARRQQSRRSGDLDRFLDFSVYIDQCWHLDREPFPFGHPVGRALLEHILEERSVIDTLHYARADVCCDASPGKATWSWATHPLIVKQSAGQGA